MFTNLPGHVTKRIRRRLAAIDRSIIGDATQMHPSLPHPNHLPNADSLVFSTLLMQQPVVLHLIFEKIKHFAQGSVCFSRPLGDLVHCVEINRDHYFLLRSPQWRVSHAGGAGDWCHCLLYVYTCLPLEKMWKNSRLTPGKTCLCLFLLLFNITATALSAIAHKHSSPPNTKE